MKSAEVFGASRLTLAVRPDMRPAGVATPKTAEGDKRVPEVKHRRREEKGERFSEGCQRQGDGRLRVAGQVDRFVLLQRFGGDSDMMGC